MEFELLNVFTRDGLGGNQLAVVYPDKVLSVEVMQQTAVNFGFSETIFIYPGQRARIFTPVGELPFAGHPTIGAAFSIAQKFQLSDFSLHVPKGEIRCEVKDDLAQIVFPGDVLIQRTSADVASLLKRCEISASDVDETSIRELNSGPLFLILPLKTQKALTEAKVMTSLEGEARPYLVYRESKGLFHVRMLSPYLKGGEDAATGSAACALAGWLREVQGEETGDAIIYQGRELGRPSEIHLSWTEDRIVIKGKSVTWGRGLLSP